MACWLSMTALLLAGAAPGTDSSAVASTQTRVDLIELNHFVDEEGREVFRQVIFYDWSKTYRRFHVRAWRLVKEESHLPQRRWNPTEFQCKWYDNGRLRQVTAAKMRETWTQEDPERVNRKLLPEDQRVPLFPAKVADTDETR